MFSWIRKGRWEKVGEMGEIKSKLMSVSEAAKKLGVSYSWILKKIRVGEIPAVMIGRRWFLSEKVVEELQQRVKKFYPGDEYVSLREVMSIIQVHPQTLYKWVRAGKFPAEKIGGKWYVRKEVIDSFVQGQFKAKD